jgi:hypothetical protein
VLDQQSISLDKREDEISPDVRDPDIKDVSIDLSYLMQ